MRVIPDSELTDFQRAVRLLRTHAQAHRWNDGIVYFIGDTAKKMSIKIGWTRRDPMGRLQSLQVGNPTRLELYGVLPGPQDREEALHSRFGSQRLVGEWFVPTPELWEIVDSSLPHPPTLAESPPGDLSGLSADCEFCHLWFKDLPAKMH